MHSLTPILAATLAADRQRQAETACRAGTRPINAPCKGTATRVSRVALLLALAATAALGVAADANALPPTTTVEVRHVTIPHGDCGSFTLLFDADVTRKITTFYDQDGVPVRDVLVRTSEGAVLNAMTGKSAPSTGVWRVTRYYADGQLSGRVTQTGRTYLVTIPGLGEIFHQTGHGTQQDGQTVFEAGPHDFEHTRIDELCAYLAS